MAGLPQFPISTQTDPYWEIPMYDADRKPLSIEGRVFEAWITPALTKQGVAEPIKEIKVLTFQDGLRLVPPTDGSGDQTIKNTLVHQVSRSFAQANFPRGDLTADLLEVVDGARRLFAPVRLFYADPAQIREFVADRAGITFGQGRQPIVTSVAIAGQAGRRGAGFITGTLPPQPSDGEDGDYFVVEREGQANLVYGPKENGEWPPRPSSTFGVGGIADVPGLPRVLDVTARSFLTVATAAAETIAASIKTVSTQAYSALGDRGGATYTRAASEPSHIAKFRSLDRYLPDGTESPANGGWWEIAADVIHTRMVGVRGVTGADATAALNSLLSIGRDVYVDPTSGEYTISDELIVLDDQRIHGAGRKSRIRQTGENKNVFSLIGRTGCVIEGLNLICSGTITSMATGGGVYAAGCSEITVKGCRISGHRGAGVNIYRTNDSLVSENRFYKSVVQAGELNPQVLADIAVVFSSSGNIVSHNKCLSGNGSGIYVQAVADGDRCDDNVITSNIVRGARCYGIILYRLDQNVENKSVSGNIVANNRVDDIKGDIINTALGTYAFGCCIYVQGAEDSEVTGNNLSRSHSGAVPFAETLAPGAIGITNVTRVTVTGNNIRDAGHAGIWVSEGNNLGLGTGFTTLTGNTITNTVKAGIRINERGRVSVKSNTLDTTQGIRVSNVTRKPDITINDNTIRNSIAGTTAGIQVAGVNGLTANDNTIDVAPIHGIAVSDCDVANLNDNIVIAHVSRGIQVQTGCTQIQVYNSNIKGANASEGIRLDAATRCGNNQITGCTNPYFGTFAPWRDLAANSNAPSVAEGVEFSFNNTAATTVTNFADGYDGQEIWIRVKDANTTLQFASSNLKGNGGVNRLMKVGDFVNAKYHRAVFAWAVNIIAAA